MRDMPAKTTSKSASTKASTRTVKAVKTPASKAEKASSKVAANAAVAPATKTKKAPTKAAAKLKATEAPTPTPLVENPVIPVEQIQLRAYFISERRQTMGWPGDSSTDWIEAEAQLIAEAKKRLKKAL